ncbi:MAG TPA: trans-aconitate 2-methyltransferase [Streptosporangiaceae bacterium]|jgi:trans-aconitate 2-methyltransferase
MSRETVPVWDPAQYTRYADERSRPFHELTGRIRATDPATVVDLGCGPGDLTATLADRWPRAQVTGVDSSPDMIARAAALTRDRLAFAQADAATWAPSAPPDVITANALFQWIPGHDAILTRLAGALAPGGTLAFQVPGNFGAPSHVLLREICRAPRWRDRLGDTVRDAPVDTPSGYLDLLAGADRTVDAWETTYLHLLHGTDAVLEWVKGTALRPMLTRLADAADRDAFVGEYAAALRDAYPQRSYGTVFPFRRVFVVATAAG